MKPSYFFLILFFCLSFVNAYNQSSLSYSRITSGLDVPEFEKGHTDFALDDIDMDGHLDLLSVGDHGSPFFNSDQHGIMVWFGDGQGNFVNYMNGQFGYGGIAVGDVNNDGLKDVGYGIHHNYSPTSFGSDLIEVVLGDGTGMEWTLWKEGLASNGETWGMFGTEFADFNNNGFLDLVSISFGCCAGLHVYLNQADGTWSPSFGFLGGGSSLRVRTFDVNKDGHIDIISGHQYGTVYFGDGTGDFVNNDTGLPGAGNTSRMGFDVAYLDPEGRVGISFITGGKPEVYAWNETTLSWTDVSGNLPTAGNYQMTQLCDMNNNGFADLMAYGNRTFQLWLGDGSGNWTPDVTFLTDGSPGSARSFRAGGDFDNNGFHDFVILTQELSGGWIQFDQNFLYVYFEDSQPDSLWIKPRFPIGGEAFYPGSVRFVEWINAVPENAPSTVKIEISAFGPNGPWWLIADSIPNNGKHQWAVPDYASEDCYLKYTVTTQEGSASVVTGQPFHIIGEPTGETIARQKEEKVMIFPNPGDDEVFINTQKQITGIVFFDIHGKIVLSVRSPETKINTSGLVAGIYFWEATSLSGKQFRGKWIRR
jgi:hypothetical protein